MTNNRQSDSGLQILYFLPASKLDSTGALSSDQKEVEAGYTRCKHIAAIGKLAYGLHARKVQDVPEGGGD